MVAFSLIPFVVAVGALVNGFIGRRWFSRQVAVVIASTMMVVAFALSVWSLVAITLLSSGPPVHDVTLGDWIPSIPLQTATGIEMFSVKWTLRLDPLSAVMAVMVSGVGLLIHLYAAADMEDEPRGGYARFFAWLSLSCASMLMLVLSGNYFVLLAGWQGTALCSFMLIGFWFENTPAANSAMKAFIVNWLGDWGLLVAIFLVYFTFGTVDFREVEASVTSMPVEIGTFGAVSGICLGLWVAAVAKSAQVPLHVWLPGAMEGPAPVSTLVQTTTMLPAGVYLIVRSAPLFERAPVVLTIVTLLGIVTALMAGSLALTHDDIKRVVMYSTISQVGVILTAIGVGALSAAVFHLITVAVSQTLLFLGSSVLVRTMDGERNLHQMGGLRQYMPATFVTMAVGALAVAGIPPLSGFFSTNEIAAGIFSSHRVLWAITSATTVLTAVSMWRLMLLTFYGSYRGPARVWPDPDSREAPMPLIVTLMALAVTTIVLGFIGISAPGRASSIARFLALTGHEQQAFSRLAMFGLLTVSIVLTVIGIVIARRFYGREPTMDLHLAERWPDGHGLLSNLYYFDELYATTVVSGVFTTARGLLRFDSGALTACVNAFGWTVQIAGWLAYMFEKHVADRIADSIVDAVAWVQRKLVNVKIF